jgi:hypothetical protein
MEIVYVGLDLGSSSFQQVAIKGDGSIKVNRSFTTSVFGKAHDKRRAFLHNLWLCTGRPLFVFHIDACGARPSCAHSPCCHYDPDEPGSSVATLAELSQYETLLSADNSRKHKRGR